MEQQIVLIASSHGSAITAWDVATGTPIASYKGNASPANGMSLLGRDYLMASQMGKGSFHFWAWHKDQVYLRSFAPEPITAVACSSDGVFCVAGGASGSLHIWETSTGRLLRTWPAHYKRVTCLAFSDGGDALVSGGDDTLVVAWLLSDVLDAGEGRALQLGGASLVPLHSWSEHTMPVAAVAVGSGGANAVVASASGDRTVKLRLLGAGTLLRSVALPAALYSLALDPGEHAVYAGAADGTIFEISLTGQDRSGDGGLPGAASGLELQGAVAMEGHTRAVTALALTTDTAHLVSGSEDGAVWVWDLRSRQPVRVLPAPTKGAVTGLVVVDRPAFMQAGGGGGQGGRKGPKRMQPLAALAKYAAAAETLKPWEGGLVLLDGAADCTQEVLARGEAEWGTSRDMAAPGAAAGGAGEGGADRATYAARLEQQWGSVAAQVQELCADPLLSGAGR